MKIANSSIAMESSHQNISAQYSSLRLGVRMKKSDWDASQAQSLVAYKPDSDDIKDDSQEKNNKGSSEEKPAAIIDISKNSVDATKGVTIFSPKEDEKKVPDKTMSTLRALLHYLKSISKNPKAYEKLEEFLDNQEKAAYASSGNKDQASNSMLIGMAGGQKRESTVLVDSREIFTAESEYTSFQASGIAKTEDGRELSFNVGFEMSRSFMEYTRTDKLYAPEPIRNVCDPLVINVGADVTSVSDQKFTFDLDADGKSDSISMLGKGSGFLALDKNSDGVINDGSELFGTKSGNGFKDLAEYDQDHNGWIDENDDVFDKLKIWYKHDDGTDRLISLKDADVGAIYLGNASTEFSLKNNDTHALNGVVRSSGIFLRESVGAGTIQHVDLAL